MKTTPFKFEKGDKVIIKDPRQNYPDAKDYSIKMGATNWVRGYHDQYFDRGDRALVLNRTFTSAIAGNKIYLIEVNKEQRVIDEKGLECLLKGILKYEK